MQTLQNYLRPLRWHVALGLLLAAISHLLSLVDPLILGRVIDDYAINQNNLPQEERIRGALIWLGIAVLVSLVARIFGTFQDYTMTYVVQSAGKQLFNDGLRQTLRLSYQEFEDTSSGATIATLQKVRGDAERFISGSVNIVFTTLVGLGFLVWYAYTKTWLLLPVFFIGLVVLGGLNGILSRQIRDIQRNIMQETRLMYGSMTESLRNVELIKSLGLNISEIRRLQTYTEKIFELELEKVRRVRFLAVMQGTILNILRQSILFLLLWLIFSNVLSAGELVSLQVIINTIFGPLSSLGGFIITYRDAETSLNIFNELMAKPVEKRPDEPVDIGQLESLRFEDVVFRHKTASQNAVDGISFAAELGETIAFVGPSGSGKSTLVKLLTGLYRPLEGAVYIDEVPVNSLRYNRVRRQMGIVTQDPQLFSGTIRENLLFVKPDATEEQMLAALDKAAATKILERADKGLDTRLGEGGMRLSGGERQRIAIARALIRDPRLLIFDEATSALDSITEKDITAVVQQLSAGRESIIILIAHRLSTITHADRIYVLERGKIVETGTHDDLLKQLGLYYAMWRQQVGERDPRDFMVMANAPAGLNEP